MQDQDGAQSSSTHDVVVAPNDNLPPSLIDPDPTAGTPSIDPADPSNLLVPAVDNTPLTLVASDYFTDPNGDPLTITPDMSGAPAWLVYDPVTNTFTGTPPVDNTGTPVVIPVAVDDGRGGTIATTITFTPVNPAPTANPDSVTTAFETPVVVDLLVNDTDPDGDVLSVVSATVPAAQGTLSNVGGVWTFTPAPGFSGTATISYTMQDQDGAQSSSTHDVVVAVPGPAPVAVNDVYAAPYGSPVNGNAAAGDTYPPGSTFAPISQPLNGTLSFNPDGTYVFTPNAGFVGTETFAYRITDPIGRTAIAVESIRVAPPSLVAVNDVYTTPINVPLNGNAAAGDTFAPGSTFLQVSMPMHGSIVFNADGSYVYTPAPGFVGVDMFAYAVTDAVGQTRFATDTITVTLPPGPVAVNDAFTTTYATPVNGNAAAGDTFQAGSTFAATSQPVHGQLVFNADGTYVYTPAAGFAGVDTFTYRVVDANGQVATATETITVTPPALAAVDDSLTTSYATPVSGNAALADTFVPGSSFAPATPPAHGTVSMLGDGTYVYTPAAGFAGSDTFTYRITDPTGQTVTATETIVVLPPALIAANDSYTTGYNTPVNGNAASGDTFAPGSVFAPASTPAHGSVTMNANGTYVYTPASGFVGTDTFDYTVTDPTGQTRTATETVIVSKPVLVAVNDSLQTSVGVPINGNAAAGDSYTPGSTFAVATIPLHGSVVMNVDGTYRYVPAPGYTGIDTFTYTITDPFGQTATATETITVTPQAAHVCLTTFGSLKDKIRR